jgi:WhiB family redox-sensing transcriptional regulator
MARYETWKLRAACRDVPNPDELFFPVTEKGKKTDISAARAICARCPVRKTCLVYSVVYRETKGVWGGMSESERRAIPVSTRRQWREVWYRVYPKQSLFEMPEGREIL